MITWAAVSINSEEVPCFVLVVECACSCLLPACSRQPKLRRRRALRKVHTVSKGSRHRYKQIHAEMVRTYQAVCCLCVPSTRDRKEKERDERIVIMCTSLKQIDWHVDQRQYDAGGPCFRRALAESAAGQEHAVASRRRPTRPPAGQAQR